MACMHSPCKAIHRPVHTTQPMQNPDSSARVPKRVVLPYSSTDLVETQVYKCRANIWASIGSWTQAVTCGILIPLVPGRWCENFRSQVLSVSLCPQATLHQSVMYTAQSPATASVQTVSGYQRPSVIGPLHPVNLCCVYSSTNTLKQSQAWVC